MAKPRLLCSHGTVLFLIAHHPGITVQELADSLVITHRTVWGLVAELRKAGLLKIQKEGRKHHYFVNEDAQFPDRLLSHLTLGEVVQALRL